MCEFVILPYYNSLEAIPHKDNLFSDLNNFISKTDKNATIAILTSPIFANDFCAQLKHDIHLKLWITVKLEKPIEHKNYLTEQHGALLILTRYKEGLAAYQDKNWLHLLSLLRQDNKRLWRQKTFISRVWNTYVRCLERCYS